MVPVTHLAAVPGACWHRTIACIGLGGQHHAGAALLCEEAQGIVRAVSRS